MNGIFPHGTDEKKRFGNSLYVGYMPLLLNRMMVHCSSLLQKDKVKNKIRCNLLEIANNLHCLAMVTIKLLK